MSNFQPDLVMDDVRASGWARIEVYGRPDYGRTLIPRARTVLGTMKSFHGVYAKQVESREATGGGGFYHVWSALPDGSQVHAITNDGHDTIRIYTAGHPVAEEKKKTRPDEFDPKAYLWVGIRAKDGNVRPSYALDAYLVEPEGAARRGVANIIFGTTHGWTTPLRLKYTSDASGVTYAPLTPDYAGYSATSMVEAMWQGYGAAGTGCTGSEQFSPGMVYGDHAYEITVSPDGAAPGDNAGSCSLTGTYNGILGMNWLDSSQEVGPYDPLMSDVQNAGQERDFSAMDITGFTDTMRFGWDAVFWLDPFDHEVARVGGKLVDARPEMLGLTTYLRQNAIQSSGAAQVLEGTYKLVCRAFDTAGTPTSTRQGEAIPDFPSNPRSQGCDYEEYLRTNSWGPLELEVEVRLGRLGITQRSFMPDPAELEVVLPGATFRFDLTCASYDDRESTTWPFGACETYDACTRDGGPNMGGPSYSQVIDIDVKRGTATIGGALPQRVIGTGTWTAASNDTRREARFFIYGNVFPAVADADWETKAARYLFTACEAVTSGVYNCSLMSEFSEGEMAAMFGGTNKANIYMYDPQAHTLTNLGAPITAPADWAINDPPDDSTNFFWYYEKAVPYKNACFNTYGVLVSSAGGFYEMEQNFVGTPGYTAPACC